MSYFFYYYKKLSHFIYKILLIFIFENRNVWIKNFKKLFNCVFFLKKIIQKSLEILL